MQVTNIVGSGKIGIEFDQEGLIEYIREETGRNDSACKDEGATEGVEFRFSREHPRATIHNSGSYIIRAGGLEELIEAHDEFESAMNELEIIQGSLDSFEVQNVVATHEIEEITNENKELKLNVFLNHVGHETAEYEPEFFTALIYDSGCGKVLVYPNGKLVISGAKSVGDVADAVNKVRKNLGLNEQRNLY